MKILPKSTFSERDLLLTLAIHVLSHLALFLSAECILTRRGILAIRNSAESRSALLT